MVIYIDISVLEKNRTNTGIQRVVKEFLRRAISVKNNISIKILSYDEDKSTMLLLSNNEVERFLCDIKNFRFVKKEPIDIENFKPEELSIFFDMDSVWYAPVKRDKIYPILKKNGFLIFNFIHDLIPVVLPSVAHTNTVKNFKVFLRAVYEFSDLVLFNSLSSQNDFLKIKKELKVNRNIPTRIVGLGSDFMQNDMQAPKKDIYNIFEKKYILFVGTLEPRKNQQDVIDAFDLLSKKYLDLNLVFIGRKGWNVDNLIKRINTNKLKNTRFFWFKDIDDATLIHFYKNAFIVVYLSKYEGYGLPIVESLRYGNITICSKNSSMYEAGKDLADYILYGSKNELVDIISLYYENDMLYNFKKEYIKKNLYLLSWDKVSNTILDIFVNFKKSTFFKKNHLKTLQFVFISINIHNIKDTIKAIDRYIDFVKEYIVVTAPKFMSKFEQIEAKVPVRVIDETVILKKYSKNFHKRDHQSKNWLLRASLLNLDILEDEFIMLDDDNRPLKKLSIDFFIAKDGSYKAYYFHNILDWNHKGTEYDIGQQNMKKILSKKNYEMLSYSSHAPQIINKAIFKEVVEEFFDIGLHSPIDEWSVYFNYAVSRYPYAFKKEVFQTLNWPASPYQWDYPYIQTDISFENYYQEIYDKGVFDKLNTYEEKLKIKSRQFRPFKQARDMFEQNSKILASNDMVHGVCKFKNKNIELYLFSIPFFVVLPGESSIRLRLNYKLLNPNLKDLDIEVAVFLNGKYRTLRKILGLDNSSYQESIIEIPIITRGLRNGMYDITFHVVVNGRYIYPKNSPYLMKLIVSDQNIDMIDKVISYASTGNFQEKLKQKLKSIPVIGRVLRWIYNHLRINNLKHIAFSNRKQIASLVKRLNEQQKQINEQQKQINLDKAHIQTLLRHNHTHHKHYEEIEKTIKLQVLKQNTALSLLFSQRMDRFIDEAKDIIKNQKYKSENLTHLKAKSLDFILDDYYLAFENIFRGDREDILKRYEQYLVYVPSDIKTALDIGCGRGEWVQLLQSNSIVAKGVDLNFAMLSVGMAKGVKNLHKADVFEFLKSTSSDSFDMVSAFHIIEHIPYEKLFVLLQEISRVAKPNATIMLETPNPQNLIVSSYEFYKDPTHLNPLPAPVVKFLMEYVGFIDVVIHYINPSSTPQKAQDYLIVAKNSKTRQIAQVVKNSKKPKLAYISPMQPSKSGIANYSAELLPELSCYYNIEVISCEQNEETTYKNSDTPVRTVAWFENNFRYYDRVLYHIGNSKFHICMIDMLKKIQGVIVLHDFYLSNLLAQAGKLNPKSLYENHGFKALQDYSINKKISKLAWKYPCNQEMLNTSLGVITHSEYSKNLAKIWFTPDSLDNWCVVPHLRKLHTEEKLLDKEKLDLPQNSFVVCSFGILGKHKKNLELLHAWLNSSLANQQNTFLVFVGQIKDTIYEEKLLKIIQNSLYPDHIRITGWSDMHTFKSYLSVCDLAVQLRSLSRGETSGTVLDCMNFEVPLIVNENGSLSELPQDAVYMLRDKFKIKELQVALEAMYHDRQKRKELSLNAKKYLSTVHNPTKCALLYFNAIEKFYNTKNSKSSFTLKTLSKDTKDTKELIKTLSFSNFQTVRQRQILVDISSIIKKDLKTGIQRVVRSQTLEMIKNTPPNCRIEPVYLSVDNQTYCYARKYISKLLKLNDVDFIEEPVDVNKGDIFYGLDLCTKEVEQGIKFKIFESYKNLGVKISFVVYDLLPVLKPQYFPKNAKDIHRKWLKNITDISDHLICISQSVANELSLWIKLNNQDKLKNIDISYLHLGADIDMGKSAKKDMLPLFARDKTVFLTVGTIEPRKGYEQLLEAFDMIWKDGVDAVLVIVGKRGWMMTEFIKRLESHPRLNAELFWFESINDESLSHIYMQTNVLVATSKAEGFGLPLVEAARYKLPIIARDIPVFKEIAQEFAYYFKDTDSPSSLANDIKKWLRLYTLNIHPKTDELPIFTWQDNANRLFSILQ